ncbi:MAG: hypothetical protein HW380_205 [Magnetococcales bacterium]|nr:hypothetical protein [Magnetococcales bacterium]HIJ84224.1 hypothetical protein [Magnetococcales bacterium]
MMRFFSTLQQRMDPKEHTSDNPQVEQEGCWKKPMNPKAKDWLGNVHPLPRETGRRFYHEDGAPSAELSGQEDLW